MKLRAKVVTAADGAGKFDFIVAKREDVGRLDRIRIVAMHKIKFASGLEPFEQGVRLNHAHLVPTHMRHFEARVIKLEPAYVAWQQAKRICVLLFRMIKRYLHAQTNSKYRHPRRIGIKQYLIKPVLAYARHTRARSPYPGKDNAIGPRYLRRVSTNLRVKPNFRTGSLHAAEVASIVIDNNCHLLS